MERLIIDRKVTLMDDEGKPLAKVDSLDDHDSEDKNDDYDFDPYDDDMYERHDILDKIQSICDNLDIKVRGRKKKYNKIYWEDPLPKKKFPTLNSIVVPYINGQKKDECKWRNLNAKEDKFTDKHLCYGGYLEEALVNSGQNMNGYSSKIWKEMQTKMTIKVKAADWDDIVKETGDMQSNNSIQSVLRRFCLAGTIYNIWKERNSRLFSDMKMDENNLLKVIINGIKYQLQSLQVKNSMDVKNVAEEWEIKFKH
ncbi:hypothetical protein Tco_0538681 [Tanacetum coccineum]